MVRVKVCGLTREGDLRAAVDAGADAVGVISGVPVDSPREVDADAAADLVDAVPPFVTSVLVTMPDSPDDAVALADRVDPDAIQVHGDVGADAVTAVRERTGRPVVVAVDHGDVARARDLAGVADALLVDSTTEEGAGGTGRVADWDAVGNLAREVSTPVVLAGGLTPENVARAIDTASPFAVDVASGVEREGGVKDNQAVRRFVRVAGRGLEGTV